MSNTSTLPRITTRHTNPRASSRPTPTAPPKTRTTRVETAPENWAHVRAAQNGDTDAFGHLYDEYAQLVYRYVLFRVSDHCLAEDITSETFLRALRRIA